MLVIDPGLLGDAIHLLPALSELRNNYPRAELHAITSPAGAGILGMSGCRVQAWPLEQDRQKRTLSAQWRVLSALRRLRFDVSINFADHDRNTFHAAFIGARHRLALRGDRWHFWSHWLIPHWIGRGARSVPVYEQRRQFLAQAGYAIGERPQFNLCVPAAEAAWAAGTVPAGAIHFSINASSPYKEWPVGHWAELARILHSRGGFIVATGSSAEREVDRLRQFEKLVPAGAAHIFAGGLSIPQLAAVIQRCRLHVGADSGAIHLAMALGLPTAGIYRDYPGRAEWTPAASPHAQLSRPCHCDRAIQAGCRAAGASLCLQQITPAEAASRLAELPPSVSNY